MKSADESPGEVTGTTIEELERFRQDIERYRARRKAVAEEFEGFVRGFKNPAGSPAVPHPQVAPAPSSPAASAMPRASTVLPPAATPTAAARPPAPAPVSVPVAVPPVTPRPAEPSVFLPPARELRPAVHAAEVNAPGDIAAAPPARRVWVPIALVAALLVAVAVWQFGGTPPDPAATGTATAIPTVAPAAASAPAPVAPPAPPADPFESVLTTTRAVWLRVTADGNRIVSRELPGGARVPFKAEKTIEIRAGDAGAVRLSIGGRDQGALGGDGAVVTRSFTVPR